MINKQLVTDDVSVIVKYIPPPNKAPVANAGTDQIVNSEVLSSWMVLQAKMMVL